MKNISIKKLLCASFVIWQSITLGIDENRNSPYIKKENSLGSEICNDCNFVRNNPHDKQAPLIFVSRYFALGGLIGVAANMFYQPFVNNRGVNKRWYGLAALLSGTYFFTNKERNRYFPKLNKI